MERNEGWQLRWKILKDDDSVVYCRRIVNGGGVKRENRRRKSPGKVKKCEVRGGSGFISQLNVPQPYTCSTRIKVWIAIQLWSNIIWSLPFIWGHVEKMRGRVVNIETAHVPSVARFLTHNTWHDKGKGNFSSLGSEDHQHWARTG